MRVPFVDLAAQEARVADDALARIADLVRSASFILGGAVDELERWLALHCGAADAVGVASGTDAIELALRALGVGPGDAVVTPAFSFVAAAEAIAAAGARPLFCDVDPRTLNATACTVGDALARGRRAGLRVRAVVPVHLFGRCVAPDVEALAAAEGLALVEDAAQAAGARDAHGRPAGGIGDAGCFSFFPTKALGCWGDGGAIATSRPELAARVRRLRAHGQSARYVYAEQGRNSRLDALQAAVLLSKVGHLEAWADRRRAAAARYRELLAGLPLELPPPAEPPSVHAWHAFVVRTEHRDELAAHLAATGVETRVYYPLALHRQPCFAGLGEPSLPVAEEACRTALALPLSSTLRPEQQDQVTQQIARFYRR